MPVSVISLQRFHRIRAIFKALFYTLPQAYDSTHTSASLSKPPESGFSIGMSTFLDTADSLITVLHVRQINLVVKLLLHGPGL
ncbi:unnamed protein product [Protopolystoma xenopodis]|uniref:Uncharacterized protein n=1 Tax=Protopolystoma xenopodis TaxID=117903 RepID=A0A448XNH6_9PLAT|nr:unnamed protein product [Protopolystoma xenopodis]